MKPKIIFFGTPRFALPLLEALSKTQDYILSAVVTAPDRPAGRKQIITPSPVKKWALEYQIPVLTPERLNKDFEFRISDFEFDVGILAAYGKIIPTEILELPKYGFLNIHPSLLPKYRGPSPVQAAILAGERETGTTIIKMDEKVDHGPIIAQLDEEIKPEDTAQTLLERLFSHAAETLITILPAYTEDRIKPREQDHKKATYTKILKREDGYIDLENPPSSEVFERMVRAYHPWPGVYTKLKMKNDPFGKTQGHPEQSRMDEKLKIVKFLPEGKLQVEGKKPMTIRDFLNGYPEAKIQLTPLAKL